MTYTVRGRKGELIVSISGLVILPAASSGLVVRLMRNSREYNISFPRVTSDIKKATLTKNKQQIRHLRLFIHLCCFPRKFYSTAFPRVTSDIKKQRKGRTNSIHVTLLCKRENSQGENINVIEKKASLCCRFLN